MWGLTYRVYWEAKEVGVRKVVGANRTGLMQQFYVESFILCFIAFCDCFLFFWLCFANRFYSILNIHIDDAFLSHPLFLKISLGLFLLSVLFAGSYPAFVLSGLFQLEVSKGKFSSGRSGVNIRKGLMIISIYGVCGVNHMRWYHIFNCAIWGSMDLGYVKIRLW